MSHFLPVPFQNYEDTLTSTRPFHGLAVFSKTPFIHSLSYRHRNVEITIVTVSGYQNLSVVGVYSAPNTPIKQLAWALNTKMKENQFDTKETVWLGDFNVDSTLNTTSSHRLVVFPIEWV